MTELFGEEFRRGGDWYQVVEFGGGSSPGWFVLHEVVDGVGRTGFRVVVESGQDLLFREAKGWCCGNGP